MSKKFSTLTLCFSLVLICSVFAQRSFAADVETAGDLKVTGMIDNTGGEGIKFPDGNIQTSACSGCAGGILSISLGGTGASNATTALTNLGGVNKTGDTMTGNLSVPSLFLGGNLTLPTTSATAGIIKVNGENLIHSYGSEQLLCRHWRRQHHHGGGMEHRRRPRSLKRQCQRRVQQRHWIPGPHEQLHGKRQYRRGI